MNAGRLRVGDILFAAMLIAAVSGNSFARIPLIDVEDCRLIGADPAKGSLMYGPEDLDLDSQGRIIVASHDRRNPESQGAFFHLDPSSDLYVEFKIDRTKKPKVEVDDLPLRPHGIAIRGERLYAVDHGVEADGAEQILVFRIGADWLTLQRTVAEDPDVLTSPNDVYVDTDGRIYFSNPRLGGLAGMMKTLLRRPNGHLGVVQPGGGRKALFSLSYPNGVWSNGEHLVVTSTRTGEALFFDRAARNDGPPGWDLASLRVQPVPGGDNITRDPSGGLLIASHTDMGAFLKHAGRPGVPSPFRIYFVEADGRHAPQVLLEHDGSRFSAASVALRRGEKLYIGQVFDPGVLVCPIGEKEEKEDVGEQ